MEPDATNPAFSQAIPLGTVAFDLLFKVVIFVSLLGVPEGAVFWRSREHLGGPFGDDLEVDFRTADKMELKREPICWLQELILVIAQLKRAWWAPSTNSSTVRRQLDEPIYTR